jgi:NAD-dependent dihydropyrimidine dehydrogenase PreA subunit
MLWGLTAKARRQRRQLLGGVCLVLPVLLVAALAAGAALGKVLSHKHPTVQLATRVLAEEQGAAEGTTDATDRFRDQGGVPGELYAEAAAVETRYRAAGVGFGVWIGIVMVGKLLTLTTGRRRREHEADRVTCIACARCYDACPNAHLTPTARAALNTSSAGAS